MLNFTRCGWPNTPHLVSHTLAAVARNKHATYRVAHPRELDTLLEITSGCEASLDVDDAVPVTNDLLHDSSVPLHEHDLLAN